MNLQKILKFNGLSLWPLIFQQLLYIALKKLHLLSGAPFYYFNIIIIILHLINYKFLDLYWSKKKQKKKLIYKVYDLL